MEEWLCHIQKTTSASPCIFMFKSCTNIRIKKAQFGYEGVDATLDITHNGRKTGLSPKGHNRFGGILPISMNFLACFL